MSHPAPPILAGPEGLRPYVGNLVTTAGIVVAGAVAYAFTPLVGDHSWVGSVVALGSLALIGPLTVHRVRAVATSEQPVLEAAQAIVLLLTVLIFGFAGLFVVIAQRPGQFVGLDTKIDAVYFVVTTLATVGYGDVHAAGQEARVVVTVQMVFDLAFLAVALRLLVGAARLRVGERLKGDASGEPEGLDALEAIEASRVAGPGAPASLPPPGGSAASGDAP